MKCPYCDRNAGRNYIWKRKKRCILEKGCKKANFMDILSGTGIIKAAKYTLLSFTIEANYCEACKKVIFETDISK